MKTAVCMLFALTMFPPAAAIAAADQICPKDIPQARFEGSPFPEFGDWFGTEALAATAPRDGTWVTTAPNAVIAVKLFWWSAGFQPGMEHNLSVTMTDLFDPERSIDIGPATNAGDVNMIGGEAGGRWAALVGIDIREAGCWEVKGEYLGQTLTFIVETILYDDWLAAKEE